MVARGSDMSAPASSRNAALAAVVTCITWNVIREPPCATVDQKTTISAAAHRQAIQCRMREALFCHAAAANGRHSASTAIGKAAAAEYCTAFATSAGCA